MPPAPALMEELEEAILLRFPPHEPERLIHAALVCKRWARLISGPAFRRRFRVLHRAPPMLGLLCNGIGDRTAARARAASCPRPPSAPRRRRPNSAAGARSTPATAGSSSGAPGGNASRWAASWSGTPTRTRSGSFPPLRGTRRRTRTRRFSAPPAPAPAITLIATGDPSSWFLCARTLGRRSFAPTHPMLLRGATQYISTQCPGDDCILSNIDPGKLVGNALYFLFLNKAAALKYDLDLQEASMVGLPPEYTCWRPAVLTATEGGGLGFANVHEHKLYMWLMKPGPGVDAAGWVQSRVIDLEMLVCNDAILTSAALVGSADGVGVVFMHASDVIYALDLKTNKVKKACEGRRIYAVIPYTSFYTPALGAVCTGEEPSAGGSSA